MLLPAAAPTAFLRAHFMGFALDTARVTMQPCCFPQQYHVLWALAFRGCICLLIAGVLHDPCVRLSWSCVSPFISNCDRLSSLPYFSSLGYLLETLTGIPWWPLDCNLVMLQPESLRSLHKASEDGSCGGSGTDSPHAQGATARELHHASLKVASWSSQNGKS